jgi:hypothetical protein
MNRPLMSALAPLLRDRTVALPLAMAGTLAALVWIMADPAGGEPMARALLAAGFILWSTDCMTRICHIEIDDSRPARPHARDGAGAPVAVFDLLEDNSFDLPARDGREVPPGPYRLALAVREKRLVGRHRTGGARRSAEFHLSSGPSGRW